MTSNEESAPPEPRYLDTTIVSAALMVGTAHHRAALDFFGTLAAQRRPIYYSTLLRLELLEALRRVGADPSELAPRLRDRFHLRRWHDSESVRVAWSRYIQDAFDNALRQFSEAHERPITEAIIERADALMNRFKIRSYDAVHVATAETAGVTHLVAVDGDFTRVTTLTVEIIRE